MGGERIFTRSGLDTAVSSAIAGERRRLAAIMTAPEAAGREKLAVHFATTTDQSVDAIRAALAGTSTANATAGTMAGGQSVQADVPNMPATPNPPKLPALDWGAVLKSHGMTV